MMAQGRWIVLAVGAGLLAISAAYADSNDADQTAPATAKSERVARLEALLDAQQRKIQGLEQQVAATGGQDQDAARVDVMRQQIREILSESEFRESLMPSTVMAGYDKGFFIRSSDDKFSLKINGRLQFRWTHYATRASNRWLRPGFQRNDRTGFDEQRIRLTFSGNVYDPNLTYHIQMRADAPDAGDVRLHYAWVNYRMLDGQFNIKAGQFRLASTRAQFNEDFALAFIDRPPTDTVFGLGIGIGVRFWGELFDKKLDYYLDVVNGIGDAGRANLARTITNDPPEHDSQPAILARLVYHVLGEHADFVSQADHLHRESPAWDLGFHYAFNDDNGDTRSTRIPFPLPRLFGRRGGFGLTTSNGLQINQFGFDSAFKWHGFSAIGEYFLRIQDVRRGGRMPFAPLWQLTGDGSTNAQQGAYVQVGYFLPVPGMEDKVEAVARVGGISTLASGQEGTWEYGAGLNYYIEKDKVKLQTDMTKVSEVPISNNYSSLANVNDDALIFRVQLQVEF